jgi:subtilisin family serine protease
MSSLPKTILRTSLLLSAIAWGAAAQNHYLVRLSPGGSMVSVASRYGLQLVAPLGGSASGLYVVNSILPLSWFSGIYNDPSVLNVEVDASIALPEVAKDSQLTGAPNLQAINSWISPYIGKSQINRFTGASEWSAYQNQPAAGIVRVAAAQQFATGAGTVAILDTGADFTHPVLASSLVLGWDFVNHVPGGYAVPVDLVSATGSILDQSTTSILDQSTTSILDQSTTSILDQSTTSILDQSTTSILDTSKPLNEYGHGTMTAGVIHLVAPTARLLPVKVFDVNGGSCLSLILEGIYYAVDQGAKVISMSFSMRQGSAELQQAIAYANSMGVVLVASAGNEGQSIVVYPAGYKQVLGIGSTNNQDVRSTFSNFGSVVSLAAPGEAIVTTYPQNRYAAGWGTSFSAPFVAGGAALLVQLNGQITPAGAKQALSQAVAVGQALGAGRLDLVRALQAGN